MKKQTKHITEGTTNKYLMGLSVMTMALLFSYFLVLYLVRKSRVKFNKRLSMNL
ncbi:hypothetical protein [Halobacillus andaensis]|uniref:hypothetical protein n=1 Tax=Halobacillus andaensis TaxID=1176239 RepID=UPI003D71AA48